MLQRLSALAALSLVLACNDATQPTALVPTTGIGSGTFTQMGTVTFEVKGLTTGPLGFVIRNPPSSCGSSLFTGATEIWGTDGGGPWHWYSEYWSYYKNNFCSPAPGPPPGYYNGGWINVYGGVEPDVAYIGQAQADLTILQITNFPDNGRVKLTAHPDLIKQCSFHQFEGFPPGQSELVLEFPSGPLPMAIFYCP